MRLRLACLALLFAIAFPVAAQSRAAELQTAFNRAQHLKRGINASSWFAQSRDYSAAATDRYTDAQDIALIEHLGFDSVRLSIDAAPLEKYPRGQDGLNAEFLSRLDRAVDAMLAQVWPCRLICTPKTASSCSCVRATMRLTR